MTADEHAGSPRAWWKRQPAVVASLILVYPLGLLLMWLFAPWSRRTKRIVTGVVVWPAGAWWISRSAAHRRVKAAAWVGAAAWALIVILAAIPTQSPKTSSTSGLVARATATPVTTAGPATAPAIPAAVTAEGTATHAPSPTPTRASTPTSTPGFSPAEVAYAAAVRSEVQTMATSMSTFGQLVASPKLGDQTWTIVVATQLAIWRQTYAEAQKLEAPPSFARTHERYLTALANLNAASYDFAKGVDNLDASLLNKAGQEIQTADDAMVQAVALMPTPAPQ